MSWPGGWAKMCRGFWQERPGWSGPEMYKLVIEDEEGRITEGPLDRESTTIGRHEDNRIRLNERNVSRHHARIVFRGKEPYLQDLRSSYGIRFNGEPLEQEAALRPGDHFQIGDFGITLEVDALDEIEERSPTPPGPGEGYYGDEGVDTAILHTQPSVSPTQDTDEFPAYGAGGQEGISVRGSVRATPPVPRLVALSRGFSSLVILFERPSILVGSGDEADTRIWHPSISGVHAELRNSERHSSVIDLSVEGRGVRVNNLEVGASDLSPGDIVELGELCFRFEGVQGGPRGLADVPRPAQQPPRILTVALGLALVAALGAIVYLLVLRTGMMSADPPGESASRLSTEVGEEMERGRALMDRRRWQEAIDLLSRVLMKDGSPEGVEDLRRKAVAELRANAALEQVRSLLGQGNLELAITRKASIPLSSVYFPEAEDLLEHYRQRLSHIAELLRRGQELAEHGNTLGAMAALREILAMDPENLDALRLRLRLRLLERRSAEAPGPSQGSGLGAGTIEVAAVDEGPAAPAYVEEARRDAAPSDSESEIRDAPGTDEQPAPVAAAARPTPNLEQPEMVAIVPAPPGPRPVADRLPGLAAEEAAKAKIGPIDILPSTSPEALGSKDAQQGPLGAPSGPPSSPEKPLKSVAPRAADLRPSSGGPADAPEEAPSLGGAGRAEGPALAMGPRPGPEGKVARAAQTQPGPTERRSLALQHFNAGSKLQRAHRLKEAVKEYRAAIKAKGSFSAPYRKLGYLYLELGQRKKACRYLNGFLKLNPDAPEAATIRRHVEEQGCSPP